MRDGVGWLPGWVGFHVCTLVGGEEVPSLVLPSMGGAHHFLDFCCLGARWRVGFMVLKISSGVVVMCNFLLV